MIAIVDYGMGNLGSIANMLKRIGTEAIVTSETSQIRKASRLILPGVGAFDNGMKNLTDRRLISIIREQATEKKIPLLGICLGMQLLTRRSDEGTMEGLGLIDAETKKFQFNSMAANLKIPHMGWNTLSIKRNHLLFEGIEDSPRFYFVHSYYVVCSKQEEVLATTDYGFEFASVIYRGNIYGVQFHPEKSHRYGMKLLSNFDKLA
jgi:glutamine amidotransferase